MENSTTQQQSVEQGISPKAAIALRDAARSILVAVENSGAPYTLSYALTQVEWVSLKSELLTDLLIALRQAEGIAS